MWILLFILLLTIVILLHRGGAKKGGKDIVKDLVKSPRTKSEARVITELEKITGEKFPTTQPDFLRVGRKRLELDGYCAKLKLAIEFSGPLHTKWYPSKETYEKYVSRIETDEIKKKLCQRAGVDLIVVDMNLPPRHYSDYLRSRLADFGKGNPPYNYIKEQQAVPWRRESST